MVWGTSVDKLLNSGDPRTRSRPLKMVVWENSVENPVSSGALQNAVLRGYKRVRGTPLLRDLSTEVARTVVSRRCKGVWERHH